MSALDREMRLRAVRRLRVLIVGLGTAMVALHVYGVARVWREVGQSFPGFVLTRDRVVAQLNQPYWPGIRAGLRPGDLVLSVDGRGFGVRAKLIDRIREKPPGNGFRYVVSRGGHAFELEVPSATFELADFFSTFGIMAATGLSFLVIGSAIVWLRADLLGVGVYAFFLAVAFTIGVSPLLAWREELPLATVWPALLLAGALHFALVFPEPSARIRNRPVLLALPYVAAAPLGVLNLWVSGDVPLLAARVEWMNRWSAFFAALALVAMLFTASRRAERAVSGVVRARIRITLWGLGLAVVCFSIGFLGAESGLIPSAPTSMFVAPAWIWFVTVALASLRDDVFDLGPRAREALMGPAVYGMTVVFYLLLLGSTLFALRGAPGFTGWLFPLGFLLVAVLLGEPLRRTARSLVAWGMNAAALLPPRALRELSAELAASLDENAIVSTVLRMRGKLGLAAVRLFLADPNGWTEAGGPVRLSPSHPLVEAIRRRTVISRERRRDDDDPNASACREELRRLGLTAVFPLRAGGECLGALGCAITARSGWLAPEDLRGFSTIAEQVAVALENAQVFARIRELEEELRAENVALKQELTSAPSLEGLVGQSPRMKRLYEWIEQVAPTDATVLVSGETGTGKELVARAVHARSRRRNRPMIRVNCAAIHPALLESEFFGHERGAFTGAVARRIGRFELADGGTIFLDEIADLPPGLQSKLLRVLQHGEFQRVGGSKTVRTDVRVIAATNRDLEALVGQGSFREDLYFRLNVLRIVVPPLRERREDIPALVACLLQRKAAKTRKRISTIDERSLRALVAYHWPGNVRELENVIERAMILSPEDRLVVRELENLLGDRPSGPGLRALGEILRDVKVQTIRRALRETDGNQAHAAALLRLKPSSLSRMMKSLGMRA